MVTKIERGGVTVTVNASDVEQMLSSGWTFVETPVEESSQPEPVEHDKPDVERGRVAPESVPAAAPKQRTTHVQSPGFSYPWPPEAPRPGQSRKLWADYARALGIEPGYMNRAELHEAAIKVLEGASK